MYADTCYESSCHSKSSKQRSDDRRPEHKKRWQPKGPTIEARGAPEADAPKKTGHNEKAPPISQTYTGCFNCGDLTHRKNDCKKPSNLQVKRVKNNDMKCGIASYENRYIIPVTINDRECTALRDTGTSLTLVSKKFLTKEGIHTTGKIMSVESVFGDARPLETVQVMISSPRLGDPNPVSLEAGVVDNLKETDMIIGHDLFIKYKNLKDPAGNFNHPAFSTDIQVSAENCNSVAIATRKTDYGVGTIDLQVSVPPSSECENPVINVTKPSDVHSNKHKDEYKIAQIENPSLSDAWTKVKQGHFGYVIHKGFLFRRQMIYDFEENESESLLAVPKGRRENILKMAHESLWGGHGGINRTKERMKLNFWWPGWSKDVAKFVQKCEICQQLSNVSKSDRAPMVLVPSVGTAFESVTMDFIGPLNSGHSSGKRFILLIICNSRHWPELLHYQA